MVQTRAMAVKAAAIKNGKHSQELQNNGDGKCHLLALPVELRFRIYEYALFADQPLETDVRLRHKKPLTLPPLTLTCHQIQQESLPTFFEVNTVRFPIARVMSAFKERPVYFGTLSKHIGLLKHIEFVLCPSGSHYSLKIGKGLGTFVLDRKYCGNDLHLREVELNEVCLINSRNLENGRQYLDGVVSASNSSTFAPVLDEDRLRELILILEAWP